MYMQTSISSYKKQYSHIKPFNLKLVIIIRFQKQALYVDLTDKCMSQIFRINCLFYVKRYL